MSVLSMKTLVSTESIRIISIPIPLINGTYRISVEHFGALCQPQRCIQFCRAWKGGSHHMSSEHKNSSSESDTRMGSRWRPFYNVALRPRWSWKVYYLSDHRAAMRRSEKSRFQLFLFAKKYRSKWSDEIHSDFCVPASFHDTDPRSND